MEIQWVKEDFDFAGGGYLQNKRSTDRPHLTDIIKSIEKQIGAGYKGPGFKERELTMEVGFIWEDVLSHVLGRRMGARFGEVECDGIVGSPDGIGDDPLGTVDVVLEEYKCTWRSTRRVPTKDWYWMCQCKSYIHMLGIHPPVAIMRILYLMGDYKGSGPLYKVARIEYTEKEVWENWQMIVNHAKDRGWL